MKRISVGAVFVGLLVLGTACRDSAVAEPPFAQTLQTFDEFPIVWLGESFDLDGKSLELTGARKTCSPALSASDGELIRPAECSFFLAYGDCEIPAGQTSCRVPVSIKIEPPCNAPLSNDVKEDAVQVRNVDAVVYSEGALYVETAEFLISISPPGATDKETLENSIFIAEHLYGANDKASALGPDTSFRPSDRSTCEESGESPAASPSTAYLAIDAAPANGSGPCDPVDASYTVPAGATLPVALCLVNAAVYPVNGGINTVTLTISYTSPLSAINAPSDLLTDLSANPDWNESGLGPVWDCNLLNASATAPRAAPSPAHITCNTVSLSDQPVSGNALLATLTLGAASAGIATVDWGTDTSLLAGALESICGIGDLECVGATLSVVPQ